MLLNLHSSTNSNCFNVWGKYFKWNFKGYLWNSTQNILPILWKKQFLLIIENLKSSQIYELTCILEMSPRPYITLQVHVVHSITYGPMLLDFIVLRWICYVVMPRWFVMSQWLDILWKWIEILWSWWYPTQCWGLGFSGVDSPCGLICYNAQMDHNVSMYLIFLFKMNWNPLLFIPLTMKLVGIYSANPIEWDMDSTLI